MSEETIWGIHAGKTGDAHSLFLKHDCVALGWTKMCDLGKIEPDREAFKEEFSKTYPDKKPGAIPNSAGQMYRFVHSMNVGDLVAYPSKHDRMINISRIQGEYFYSKEFEDTYVHRRPVKWLKTVPRTQFSQGALYEIGCALSLFQIKNFADEYFAALEGKPVSPPVDEDETVVAVAEDIEETTRDFIIKRLAKELKGNPFEHFVAHLLQAMGYRTRVTQASVDGGVDILAHKDELGFEPPIIKVQVKAIEGSVGDPVVSALYGKVESGEFGLLVTLGKFTNQAKNFAVNKSNLRLIDGDELVDLILQHYERFDSKYKGLLPLKKVFIPEQIKEAEE